MFMEFWHFSDTLTNQTQFTPHYPQFSWLCFHQQRAWAVHDDEKHKSTVWMQSARQLIILLNKMRREETRLDGGPSKDPESDVDGVKPRRSEAAGARRETERGEERKSSAFTTNLTLWRKRSVSHSFSMRTQAILLQRSLRTSAATQVQPSSTFWLPQSASRCDPQSHLPVIWR